MATFEINIEWLTVGQVSERTGIDVQRVRRMVDNGLVGNKDPKTNVRFINDSEIETVVRIAKFMDSTPNSTYEQAREFILKDELLDVHKKQEEVKAHEIAFQNTILQFLQAQKASQSELVEQVTDRITERLNTHIDDKLDQRFAEFQKGMLETIMAHQSLIESDEVKIREKRIQEQQEVLQRQADALEKLAREVDSLKEQKEQETHQPKKKKFFGLF